MTLTVTIQSDKWGYVYNISGIGGGATSDKELLAKAVSNTILKLPDPDKK